MKPEDWKSLNGEMGDFLFKDLEELIASHKFYPYVKDKPSDFGTNVFSIYADIYKNRLYMVIENGGKKYCGRICSPLAVPSMVDRIWGMDVMDGSVCSWLSDMMISVLIDGKTEEYVLEEWRKNK